MSVRLTRSRIGWLLSSCAQGRRQRCFEALFYVHGPLRNTAALGSLVIGWCMLGCCHFIVTLLWLLHSRGVVCLGWLTAVSYAYVGWGVRARNHRRGLRLVAPSGTQEDRIYCSIIRLTIHYSSTVCVVWFRNTIVPLTGRAHRSTSRTVCKLRV